MNDAQLQALGDDDPWLALTLLRPHTRLALGYLAQLPPEQVKPLLAGSRLHVPFRALPPLLQAALAAWLRDEVAKNRWTPPFEMSDLDRMLAEGGVLAYTYNNIRVLWCVIQFTVPGKDPELTTREWPLVVPRQKDEPVLFDNGLGEHGARRQLRVALGMSPQDAEVLERQELYGEAARDARRAQAERERQERLASAPPRFGDGSEPDAALESPLAGTGTYSTIEGLCDRLNASLVCHYFARADRDLSDRFEKDTPAGSVLDQVADRMGLIWAYSEGSVVITNTGLAAVLAAEIPGDLLAKWRARIANQSGLLTLDDLAEMAMELSAEQLYLPPTDLLRAGPSMTGHELAAFRFYGSLTWSQRVAAWSKDGLPYGSLTASQQALFDKAAFWPGDPHRPANPVPTVFRVVTRERSVWFTYGFTNAPVQEFAPVGESRAVDPTGSFRPEPGKVEPAPLPDEPHGLAAALVLARWAFVQRDVTIEGDPVVTLRTGRGDQARECLVHVGDELEGAVLTRVESDPDRLVFRAGEVQITLPKSRAVSLAPWKVSR